MCCVIWSQNVVTSTPAPFDVLSQRNAPPPSPPVEPWNLIRSPTAIGSADETLATSMSAANVVHRSRVRMAAPIARLEPRCATAVFTRVHEREGTVSKDRPVRADFLARFHAKTRQCRLDTAREGQDALLHSFEDGASEVGEALDRSAIYPDVPKAKSLRRRNDHRAVAAGTLKGKLQPTARLQYTLCTRNNSCEVQAVRRGAIADDLVERIGREDLADVLGHPLDEAWARLTETVLHVEVDGAGDLSLSAHLHDDAPLGSCLVHHGSCKRRFLLQSLNQTDAGSRRTDAAACGLRDLRRAHAHRAAHGRNCGGRRHDGRGRAENEPEAFVVDLADLLACALRTHATADEVRHIAVVLGGRKAQQARAPRVLVRSAP